MQQQQKQQQKQKQYVLMLIALIIFSLFSLTVSDIVCTHELTTSQNCYGEGDKKAILFEFDECIESWLPWQQNAIFAENEKTGIASIVGKILVPSVDEIYSIRIDLSDRVNATTEPVFDQEVLDSVGMPVCSNFSSTSWRYYRNVKGAVSSSSGQSIWTLQQRFDDMMPTQIGMFANTLNSEFGVSMRLLATKVDGDGSDKNFDLVSDISLNQVCICSNEIRSSYACDGCGSPMGLFFQSKWLEWQLDSEFVENSSTNSATFVGTAIQNSVVYTINIDLSQRAETTEQKIFDKTSMMIHSLEVCDDFSDESWYFYMHASGSMTSSIGGAWVITNLHSTMLPVQVGVYANTRNKELGLAMWLKATEQSGAFENLKIVANLGGINNSCITNNTIHTPSATSNISFTSKPITSTAMPINTSTTMKTLPATPTSSVSQHTKLTPTATPAVSTPLLEPISTIPTSVLLPPVTLTSTPTPMSTGLSQEDSSSAPASKELRETSMSLPYNHTATLSDSSELHQSSAFTKESVTSTSKASNPARSSSSAPTTADSSNLGTLPDSSGLLITPFLMTSTKAPTSTSDSKIAPTSSSTVSASSISPVIPASTSSLAAPAPTISLTTAPSINSPSRTSLSPTSISSSSPYPIPSTSTPQQELIPSSTPITSSTVTSESPSIDLETTRATFAPTQSQVSSELNTYAPTSNDISIALNSTAPQTMLLPSSSSKTTSSPISDTFITTSTPITSYSTPSQTNASSVSMSDSTDAPLLTTLQSIPTSTSISAPSEDLNTTESTSDQKVSASTTSPKVSTSTDPPTLSTSTENPVSSSLSLNPMTPYSSTTRKTLSSSSTTSMPSTSTPTTISNPAPTPFRTPTSSSSGSEISSTEPTTKNTAPIATQTITFVPGPTASPSPEVLTSQNQAMCVAGSRNCQLCGSYIGSQN